MRENQKMISSKRKGHRRNSVVKIMNTFIMNNKGSIIDENNYSLIENHLKDHPEDTEKIMNHLTNSIKEISPVIFVTFEAIIGFILIISIPIYKAIRHASYNHYQNNIQDYLVLT